MPLGVHVNAIMAAKDLERLTLLAKAVEIFVGPDERRREFLGLTGAVTRAYKGPTVTTYTLADADALLTKKLKGILEASSNVSAADKWQKQILHVWTLRPDWVPILKQSWDKLDAAIKADTVVLVTVEEGSDSVVKDTCQ